MPPPMPQIGSLPYVLGVTAPIVATIVSDWDPANKNANINLITPKRAITTAGGFSTVRGSKGKNSGKIYFEALAATGGSNFQVGVANSSASLSNYLGSSSGSIGYNGPQGAINGGTGTPSTYTTMDVVGVAVDLGANQVYFSKNGVWQASGDPVAGTGGSSIVSMTPPVFPAWSTDVNGASVALFTQATFYTPPSGYSSWG